MRAFGWFLSRLHCDILQKLSPLLRAGKPITHEVCFYAGFLAESFNSVVFRSCGPADATAASILPLQRQQQQTTIATTTTSAARPQAEENQKELSRLQLAFLHLDGMRPEALNPEPYPGSIVVPFW